MAFTFDRVGRSWSLGFVGSCLLLASTVACGGSSKSAESPEGGSSEKGGLAVAPLPPLEPARAPANLVLRARVSSLEKLASGALEGASVPFDLKTELPDLKKKFADSLPPAFDETQPIEAVLALNVKPNRQPYIAFSVGVTQLQEALRELSQRGLDPREGPSNQYYFSYESFQCALGRSLGPSLARIVCADDDESLQVLLPYSLRGLPAEKLSGADVHVDFDMKPLRATYGRQIRSLKLLASVGARQLHVDEPRFDRAVSDIAVALADELAAWSEDLDGAELRIQENRGSFRVDVELRAGAKTSWLAQGTAELAGQQAPAPTLFSNLPAEAPSAAYSRSFSAERLAGARTTLTNLAGGYASHLKLSAPIRNRVESWVSGTFALSSGLSVQAVGPIVQQKLKGVEYWGSGWSVVGFEVEKKGVVTWLEDLAALLSSKEVRALDKEVAEFLPEFQRQAGGLSGAPQAAVFRWKLSEAMLKELEAERQQISDVAEPEESEDLGSAQKFLRELGEKSEKFSEIWREGYVAVESIGGVTFLAFGFDKAQLGHAFAALKSSDSPRLATLPELSALRVRPALAASFIKVEGVANYLTSFLSSGQAKKFLELLASTPNRGQIPVTYFVEVDSAENPSLKLSFEVPQGFITDVATLTTLAVTELFQ